MVTEPPAGRGEPQLASSKIETHQDQASRGSPLPARLWYHPRNLPHFDATQRGTDLGLTDEEIAFYDALAANESAKIAMGDAKLRLIATELVTQVRKSVTIDWTLRDGAQAKIRVMVKRILNKYGYPPDMQDAAVQEVLAQARELCADWAVA
jgi:hypothetical protein